MLSGNLFSLSGSFGLFEQLHLDLVLMWKFKQIFLPAEKNASSDKRHVWCMLLTLFLYAPIFCVGSTQPEDLDILSSDFQLTAVYKIMPCQDYLYCRYGMMKAGSVKRFLRKWSSANFNRSLEQPVSNTVCWVFVPHSHNVANVNCVSVNFSFFFSLSSTECQDDVYISCTQSERGKFLCGHLFCFLINSFFCLKRIRIWLLTSINFFNLIVLCMH